MLDFALEKKNLLTFCGLFWIFFISLNLRGHKESAEEEVLYSSQTTEGKYHLLQLSHLHLLISQFRFIQSRDFFILGCVQGRINFFFKLLLFQCLVT